MASDIERGQYGNKESFKLKFNSIVKVMNSAVELLNLIYLISQQYLYCVF